MKKNKDFEELINQIQADVNAGIQFDKAKYFKQSEIITQNLLKQKKQNLHDVARALYVYENKTVHAISKILGIDRAMMSRIKKNSPQVWEVEKKILNIRKYDTTSILRRAIYSLIDMQSKKGIGTGNYADIAIKLSNTYKTLTFKNSKTAVNEVLDNFSKYLYAKCDIDIKNEISDFIFFEFYIDENL